MQIIADLHLHSKYSRAVSPQMNLEGIADWVKKKGIDLATCADWTHPFWFAEIKSKLKENDSGIYNFNGVNFMLTTEISTIFSQGGRGRRVHNLVFSPSLATCEKIITELKNRGANLKSDGRPIIGLSSKELLELIMEIDENCLLIPAHCLPPNELIETKNGLIKISKLNTKDYVLSHTGNYRKVMKIFKRETEENLFKITPWYYSQAIQTTGEHPYLAVKTIKKCSSTGDTCIPFGEHIKRCTKKLYKQYKKEWIQAKNLEVGDFICLPILKKTIIKNYITIKNQKITLNNDFCLLIGYFLAEGCIDDKGGITFTFSSNEIAYGKEVIDLMSRVFNITHFRIYKRKQTQSQEIIFYSKNIAHYLKKNFYSGQIKKAPFKTLPQWMIYLPLKKQVQLFLGWFRGDGGYTSSVNIISSFNKILLRLGIIPFISVNTKEQYNKKTSHVYKGRRIRAKYDNYQIRFSFNKNKQNIFNEKIFQKFKTKISRRHGFIDENYVYLPIREISISKYKGSVFNLEVDTDHSYSTWVTSIHNCWTPWFAMYGSKSGFDSIEECFGKENAKYIYGVETGLSSDPIMNWQIKDLDNRSILSFSDAHSGAKMAREATVFTCNTKHVTCNIKYQDIVDAIKQKPNSFS